MILWTMWMLCGAFGWSAAEYLLHRFWGHEAHGKNEFSREHLKHHGKTKYFTPTPRKARAAAAAMALVTPPCMLLLGAQPGAAFAVGFFAFYVFYEVLHRRVHTAAPRGPYGRWARKHHLLHHFVDARMNHGVTSPLWDLVFGTYRTPATIPVPRRLCMTWLLDPATGDVHAAHAAIYRLRR